MTLNTPPGYVKTTFEEKNKTCVPHRGHGFRLGAYKCVCHPGYYNPTSSVDGSTAVRCIPCAPGCPNCKDARPCEAKPRPALRIALISVQLGCMLLILFGMTVVYHARKNKSVRSSGILLLEFLLFGSLLLSFPVFILYFDPSVFRCIALRWVRLLGFAIVYGIIILKLHRVLKVFLARTAQRLPYLTSGRMLRVLFVILLVVVWFLVAWTMATWHNLSLGVSLVEHNTTYSGLRFLYCRLEYWDYMLSLAEFLFLCWGLYLCYAVRTVPSVYHEPWYMTGAIINEMSFSLIFHVLQFTMTSRMHPDWMLLAVFTHTHLTVSVTVGLLLIPKFACGTSAPRDDIAVEPYEDELDVMRRSGSYLNSSITSAWSEHSVDPDDLRDELKRLYAQLEFYKGQKMLINNPHLQKKRSLKKGLGRSIMRRITELPDNVTRRDDRERCDSRGSSAAGTPHTPCSSKRSSTDPRPRDEHFQQLQQSQANHRPFILPKSYSSYDHLLEQPELGPASERSEENAVAAEIPQVPGEAVTPRPSSLDKAEADSLDSVPLVCRSASAHNLSAANKRPAQHHARPSLLQKSLSLISGTRERTLAHGNKACSMEDGHDEMAWKDTVSGDSVSCGKMKSLAEHRILTENTVCAKDSSLRMRPGEVTWNQQHKKHGSSEEKHSCVTFADASQANNDEYDREEVCPWEFQDLPSTTQHASGEGQKPQKHVSIAPDSIKENDEHDGPLHVGQSKTTNKQRNLSDPNREVEEAEALPGSLSSVFEEMQESEDPMNTQLISPTMERKAPSKTDVCPWEIQDVPESTTDDRGQAACTETADIKGQKANLADICPWEMEDEIPCSSRSNSPGELKISEKLASEKMTNGSHTKPKQQAKGFGFNFKNLVNIGRKKADHGQKGSTNDKAVLPLTQTQKQVNVPKEAKE
uniref:metabotropic glycine receptor-like n=1 Tax=Myxine glutinosa TaxID=7769 RepID=UPI0035901372